MASTGRLRVAFLGNNAAHATRDRATGTLKGPAIDLGMELARRLEVRFEPVQYRTVAEMVKSVSKGEWDIISIGINRDRLRLMDFSPAYSQIEIGYLVGRNAPVSEFSRVDSPGIRIAVLQRGDADILLSKALKHATLIRTSTSTIGESLQIVESGKADATAAIRTFLIPASARVPGSRVLEGRLKVQEIAIAVPEGSELSADYLRRFIAELKARGFVKESIERAAVPGLMAAP